MEELAKGIGVSDGRTRLPHFSGVLRAACALLPAAATAAVSALLASYSPFEGIAPFGLACIIGAWYSGSDPYPAAFGAVLGYLLLRSFAFAVAAAALGAAVYLVSSRRSVARILRPLIAFGAETLCLAAISLIFRMRALLLLCSAPVSVFAGLVVGEGMRALRSFVCGRELSDTELLTLSAAAGLVTLSMRSFNIWGQSPAMIFAGACVLFAAMRLGVSAAAVAVTVGAGRILATGGDMHFIAVLAASALAAASVRALGKWAPLIGFAAINLLFTAAMGGVAVFGYIETAAACLIYALVPARLYMRDTPSDPRVSRYGELEYRVASLADVLSELARVKGSGEGRLLRGAAETLRGALNVTGGSTVSFFSAEYGHAGSVKRGSSASGDSCAVKETGGKLLLALSDGMGSGSDACEESRSALALLSDLVSVGFGVDEAAGCVNEMLLKDSRGDMYATLDVMMIDLSDGAAVLRKHGAPPSYVLRGGKLFTLSMESLPVGILEDVGSGGRSVRLKPGDTVIMMSDGVADALGTGLAAAINENVLGWGDPGLAARSLVEAAGKHGRDDDMTVLIARIEQNENCA